MTDWTALYWTLAARPTGRRGLLRSGVDAMAYDLLQNPRPDNGQHLSDTFDSRICPHRHGYAGWAVEQVTRGGRVCGVAYVRIGVTRFVDPLVVNIITPRSTVY